MNRPVFYHAYHHGYTYYRALVPGKRAVLVVRGFPWDRQERYQANWRFLSPVHDREALRLSKGAGQ